MQLTANAGHIDCVCLKILRVFFIYSCNIFKRFSTCTQRWEKRPSAYWFYLHCNKNPYKANTFETACGTVEIVTQQSHNMPSRTLQEMISVLRSATFNAKGVSVTFLLSSACCSTHCHQLWCVHGLSKQKIDMHERTVSDLCEAAEF